MFLPTEMALTSIKPAGAGRSTCVEPGGRSPLGNSSISVIGQPSSMMVINRALVRLAPGMGMAAPVIIAVGRMRLHASATRTAVTLYSGAAVTESRNGPVTRLSANAGSWMLANNWPGATASVIRSGSTASP